MYIYFFSSKDRKNPYRGGGEAQSTFPNSFALNNQSTLFLKIKNLKIYINGRIFIPNIMVSKYIWKVLLGDFLAASLIKSKQKGQQTSPQVKLFSFDVSPYLLRTMRSLVERMSAEQLSQVSFCPGRARKELRQPSLRFPDS